MTEKWSQRSAKQIREDRILTTLTLQGPQRWSDLLKETELSSRTLKKYLDRLILRGKVYREQKNDEGYPPPVFYGLTLIGKDDAEPFHFGHRLKQFLYGFTAQTPLDIQSAEYRMTLRVIRANGTKKTLETIWKTPYTGMTKEQIFESIGRRVGVAYLYSLLKSYDTKNFAWYSYALDNLLNEPIFSLLFSGASTGLLTSKDINELKDLLKQIYPEEHEELERILK